MLSEEITLRATAKIACAYFSGNPVPASEVGQVITSIHGGLTGAVEQPEKTYVPAIDPKKSIKPDHLISLIDGRPYKMLKRHLSINGFTPDEYRQRYGLKPDYPMTAANYSEKRRELAKSIGLGRKPGQRVTRRAA